MSQAAKAVCLTLVGCLRTVYVLGLQTFGASLYLELDLRAFLKRSVAIHLDRREVHEHIIAIGTLDKSVSLGGIKPFDNTFFSHY
jgi:hypothetical protein